MKGIIMSAFKDISGQKFGRLLVIKPIGKTKYNKTIWLCKCDCGNEKCIPITYLTSGDTKSCGCLNSELVSKRVQTHNKTNTRLYKIHVNMKDRCYNQSNLAFKDYGGRNISICEEWLNKENGFINFYNWAMNNSYRKDLTLDRINNDDNYKPDNCKWSTNLEQARNRRSNIKYKNKCIKDWCKELNLNYGTVMSRINNLNWTIEESLEIVPKQKYRKKGLINTI
jgi:hypothetical protein